MLIAIDAGHYNDTPGKRCMKAIDPKETRERYLNARMAEHVEELLKAYDCEVMRCDDRTGKTDPSLSERAARANRAGAGAFISIHHNAGINGGKGGGICVFAAENASKTSLELQRAVYDETVKRTGLKGNRATPLPVANFTVIYKANMPAVLGEFGFMDSTTDVPIILTDDFSVKCAPAIVAALASKGVAVPAGTKISGLAALIESIQTGGAAVEQISFTIDDGGSNSETFSVVSGTTWAEWIGTGRLIFNDSLVLYIYGGVVATEAGVYAVSLDGSTAVSGGDEIVSGATYTIINWGG